MNRVLAADVGGTHIRTAIVDAEGNIRAGERTQARLSREGVTGHDVATAVVAALRHSMDSDGNIMAIGIGFPGFFRGDSGIVAASPNIPSLQDFPLAEVIAQECKMPTCVQNDALCAAIGEQRFGAGQGRPNLLHLTLGTGIGGGLILNHAPYFGESGMATEIGHLCVDSSSKARPCGCGNQGCLEAYASATAVAQRYAELTGKPCEAKEIHALACQGDKPAVTVVEDAGRYLGKAIAEAVKLLDLRTVTISGGLTGAWDLLYPLLISALNDSLLPPQKGHVAVLRSTLDDDAGLLGAAWLAHMAI